MILGLYWIDILYVVLLLMTVWVQWDRGLLAIVADLLAWFSGLIIGFTISEYMTEGLGWYTSLAEDYIRLVSFFLVTVMVVYMVSKTLQRLFERVEHQNLGLSWQRLIGGLAAAGYGTLVLIFVTHLVVQVGELVPQLTQALETSQFYQQIYLPWTTLWLS